MNEVSIIINGVRYDMVRVLKEDACCCDCDLRPFCNKYDLVNFCITSVDEAIFKKSDKKFEK